MDTTGGLGLARFRPRLGELGPPVVQGIGTLASLDRYELCEHLAPLGGSEPGDGLALGFNP